MSQSQAWTWNQRLVQCVVKTSQFFPTTKGITMSASVKRSGEFRDGTFGQKWVRLAPNGTNPWFFNTRFQYILARRAKMYWNLIQIYPRREIWSWFLPYTWNLIFKKSRIGPIWCQSESAPLGAQTWQPWDRWMFI